MFPIREALLYDITALAKFHWVLSACSEPARSEWRCKGRQDRRKEGTKPLSRLVPLPPPPCHPNKTPHPVRPVTPFPALAADGFGDVRAGAAVGGSSYFRCLMDVNIGVPRPNFTVILGAVRLCCCLAGRSFNTLRYSHALLIHNRSLNSCCSMFCGMEPFSSPDSAPDITGW